MNETATLTLLLAFPLLGALLILLLPERPGLARAAALGVAALELAFVTLCLLTCKPPQTGAPAGFLLYTDLPWIPALGIRYILGLDGISLLMLLLTAAVTLVAIVTSWQSVTKKTAIYYSLILFTQFGVTGVFLSLDLILFYIFWEVMLIPLFFLIGIWGNGRNLYAALKFFLYTLAGSLLMLLAIISLHLLHGEQSGVYTFALFELMKTAIPHEQGIWLFAAMLVAFAIKLPLFPLHSWLPDTYESAPPAATILLAGVLAKSGAYGLLRFAYPLFPEAAAGFTPLVMTLAVCGIVYAAWIAFAQEDMKRLIAYSSIAHMGFVALGIAAWNPLALSGALMLMVGHGVATGGLFAMAAMLEERTGCRKLADFGGLWGRVPRFAALFLLFAMASAGLPGLCNFVGEFLILTGSFKASPMAAIAAFAGVVLALVYTLLLVQKLLFQGEGRFSNLTDLTHCETILLVALAAAVIILGIHPAPFLELIKIPIAVLTGGRS